MRRVATTTIASVAVLLVGVGSASASCLGSRDPEGEFRKAVMTAPVVFVGDVVATTDRNRSAKVAVVEVWRGPPLPAEIVVRGSQVLEPNVYSSVDRYFAAGTRYLFLPSGETSPFSDHACSFTREYSSDFARLRPASATNPAPSAYPDPVGQPVSGASSSSWIVVGAGAIAIVTFVARAIRRRSLRKATG